MATMVAQQQQENHVIVVAQESGKVTASQSMESVHTVSEEEVPILIYLFLILRELRDYFAVVRNELRYSFIC